MQKKIILFVKNYLIFCMTYIDYSMINNNYRDRKMSNMCPRLKYSNITL